MAIDRRTFLGACGTAMLAAHPHRVLDAQPHRPLVAPPHGPAAWREAFPALAQRVNGHPLTYLDSAATTLRPRAVIDAVARFDETDNANPAPALHTLARRAATAYGEARARIARFLNAAGPDEIVVTKGTTEAINLVASAWGSARLSPGDEIVLTIAEHYSNLLPWRSVAARTGARVVVVNVDDHGRLQPERIARAITARTRLVAVSHVSNVLGHVNPAEAICRLARDRGVTTLLDAAQSAPHVRLDVQAIGADFVACSGHKILGPMGTGVLWAARETLDAMPPYHQGSNMAHDVAESVRYEHGGAKYQAGTPNVSGTIGLAAAIGELERMDLDAIRRHDTTLVRHFAERATRVPGLRVIGSLDDAESRVPVFTFTLAGVAPGAVVQALDARGIAVRAGDMAALPLLARFGVAEAVRASCYLYTTAEDVDRLVEGLTELARRR